MARTRLYRDGNLALENFPPADISEYIVESGTTVWLDLCRPTPEDLAMVTEEFGLHELAVEDAGRAHQRPKVDRYRTHSFISTYALLAAPDGGPIEGVEVAAFITPNALITVRQDPRFDMDAVVARWDGNPDLAKYGVGFLLHGLLDVVVDGYFTVVQDLDDGISDVEDLLFDESRDSIALVQRRAYNLRKSLTKMRRVVMPMREVVNTLMRRDLHVVEDPLLPYYQDVYDHVLRATEWTESLRDTIGSVMETNLTVQGNRLNMIMKKVTSWAAVIAVPTAVTGFYGQNVPYPGFSTEAGFITSSAVIVVLSVVLYALFKRKDWI